MINLKKRITLDNRGVQIVAIIAAATLAWTMTVGGKQLLKAKNELTKNNRSRPCAWTAPQEPTAKPCPSLFSVPNVK